MNTSIFALKPVTKPPVWFPGCKQCWQLPDDIETVRAVHGLAESPWYVLDVRAKHNEDRYQRLIIGNESQIFYETLSTGFRVSWEQIVGHHHATPIWLDGYSYMVEDHPGDDPEELWRMQATKDTNLMVGSERIREIGGLTDLKLSPDGSRTIYKRHLPDRLGEYGIYTGTLNEEHQEIGVMLGADTVFSVTDEGDVYAVVKQPKGWSFGEFSRREFRELYHSVNELHFLDMGKERFLIEIFPVDLTGHHCDFPTYRRTDKPLPSWKRSGSKTAEKYTPDDPIGVYAYKVWALENLGRQKPLQMEEVVTIERAPKLRFHPHVINGQLVYRTRYGFSQESWCADGSLILPQFDMRYREHGQTDRVSDLFQYEDGSWCYWVVIENHLYLMELYL